MSGCNSCTHPTCPHSMNSNGLSSCLECDLGILVLDPSAAPKWKLGCNRCDVIIHLFENAHKVTVDTDTCDCGAQLVTVEYKQVMIGTSHQHRCIRGLFVSAEFVHQFGSLSFQCGVKKITLNYYKFILNRQTYRKEERAQSYDIRI